MAKFASHCMVEMKNVTRSLEATLGSCHCLVAVLRLFQTALGDTSPNMLFVNRHFLYISMPGPDTGDIALRVGLHSGPVTAGVLRGLRGRFQLFGDSSKFQIQRL